MFEASAYKKELMKILIGWDYNKDGKASAYLLARRMGCSETLVIKILRYLKDEHLAEKSKGGSWHLI